MASAVQSLKTKKQSANYLSTVTLSITKSTSMTPVTTMIPLLMLDIRAITMQAQAMVMIVKHLTVILMLSTSTTIFTLPVRTNIMTYSLMAMKMVDTTTTTPMRLFITRAATELVISTTERRKLGHKIDSKNKRVCKR